MEAVLKSHNVGVQHLLIGFHVVAISLKATLGGMLERAAVHVAFQGGKSFLIAFDLLVKRWCNSSRNISVS